MVCRRRLPQSTLVSSSTTVRNLSPHPLLRKFYPLKGPGHGRGPDDRFPMSATCMLVMSSAGRLRMPTSSGISTRPRDLDYELWL